MPIVKMPDGAQVRFPDDMPAEQIKGIIASKFPNAVPQAPVSTAEQGNLKDAGVTWLENTISGIPVAGPMIQSASDYLGSNIQGLITGENPEDIRAGLDARRNARNDAYPASAISGQVAGNLATMTGLGATAAGAESLGITGAKLLPRAANSAASSALISGADAAARGEDPSSILSRSLISGGIGGAIPLAGAGITAAAKVAGAKIAPTINALTNPGEEASRRLGMALQRDLDANPAAILNAADEAAARMSGVPIANVDRGGETTRALARSVANQSPEARAAIENLASDRFGSQSQRAADFINRLTGGRADDLVYQEALDATARQVNKPAYRGAYASPQAQQLFTPRMQELMQSPSLRKAVEAVPKRSADRGAIEGFKEIPNPFEMNSRGAYVLRKKADGTFVAPTLQFWDHVQRNLASDISKAVRKGDNTRVAELTGLKNELLKELDSAVPAFKSARQGAAGFFAADNALEAGRKFANTPKLVPEAVKAFQSFKPVEKEAFATGYASELIDKIKASPDRSNVINSMFKSQAGRESMSLVFGPQKMKEIEAYVRVEDIVDRLRGAMGNSTTARQLVELGIGAGAGGAAGYGISGDWKGALIGAAGPRAAKYLGQRADAQVMEQIGKLLTANNPSALKVAVQQAAKNPAYMDAIEKIGRSLAGPSRALSTNDYQ